MLKEELITQIETLAADQDKFSKFRSYVDEFHSVPRCKKGVLEFVRDLFNTQNVAGLGELAIELLTDKTSRNSSAMTRFIYNHPITLGHLQALKDQREVVMCGIAKYITETAERLHNSDLEDKAERQVYLRRAVARFRGLLGGTNIAVSLDTLDWSEVEPPEYIDYLCSTLDELVAPIHSKHVIQEWADVWGDAQGLDRVKMILSLRSYLNYLDTFLEY